MNRIGRIVGVILTSCLFVGIGFLVVSVVGSPTPPLPPLLQDVTALGGMWGACPAQNDEEAQFREGRRLALSPELNQRLERGFPPGSDESKLVDTLKAQGFDFLPPCQGDDSIHAAAFNQHGGGLFLYPLWANVFWKVDQNHKIVWTQGFVRYIGL